MDSSQHSRATRHLESETKAFLHLLVVRSDGL